MAVVLQEHDRRAMNGTAISPHEIEPAGSPALAAAVELIENATVFGDPLIDHPVEVGRLYEIRKQQY